MPRIPNQEEINLMHKFLNDKLSNKGNTLNNHWFVSKYNLEHSIVEIVNGLLGEYSKELDLATTELVDNKHIIVGFKEPEIVDFIGNGGFKVYFSELKKEKDLNEEYRNNIFNNARPTKWYKKVEFWIPVAISLLAVIIPQLKTNEGNNYMNKPEILQKVDSIYKASQNYSDSLFCLTNTAKENEVDSLNEK